MSASQRPTLANVFASRTTIAADGTVEGYASLFGEIDQARDMMMAGAFRQTLMLRGVRRIPMLFQHDPAEPIGVWLELVEDSRGLFARGRLIPDVQRGREVLALVKAGAHRRPLDRLQDREGARRSAHAHPPDRTARPLGDFHRHVPAADAARACAPSRTRARRRMAQGDRHERLFRRYPRFSFARTKAEAEWKSTLARRSTGRARDQRVARCASRSRQAASRLEPVHTNRQAPAFAARSPHPRLDRGNRVARDGRPQGRVRPAGAVSSAPRTNQDDMACIRTSRNGSRTSASAGCVPTGSGSSGRMRTDG